MSDEKYYVRFRGRTLGPFDQNKIRALINRGQVTRMHELSPDGISWQQAESFSELFPRMEIIEQTSPNFSTTQATETQPDTESIVAPSVTAQWYAHLNNENKGPVTKEQIGHWIASGAITPETLIWQDGREDWEPANIAVPELFAVTASPEHAVTPAQQSEPTIIVQPTDSIVQLPASDSKETKLATISLVLSCIGLFAFGIILCPIALVLAIVALNKNEKNAVTALIVSIIVFIISLLLFLYMLENF